MEERVRLDARIFIVSASKFIAILPRKYTSKQQQLFEEIRVKCEADELALYRFVRCGCNHLQLAPRVAQCHRLWKSQGFESPDCQYCPQSFKDAQRFARKGILFVLSCSVCRCGAYPCDAHGETSRNHHVLECLLHSYCFDGLWLMRVDAQVLQTTRSVSGHQNIPQTPERVQRPEKPSRAGEGCRGTRMFTKHSHEGTDLIYSYIRIRRSQSHKR